MRPSSRNLGDQGRRRHAFGDQAVGDSNLMDRSALPVSVLRELDADDAERGWNPFQHLTRGNSDLTENATAIRTGAMIEVEGDFLAWQVIG